MCMKSLLSFSGIVAFCASSAFAESPNLIKNSSFELGMPGFEVNCLIFPDKEMDLKSVAADLDKTTKVHGKTSLKISNPKSNFFRLMSDNIRLAPGKEYYVSAWMKSNIEKYPVRLLVESVAKGTKWNSKCRLHYLSKEWKRYGFQFKVPENGIHTDYVLRVESEPVVKRLASKNPRIAGTVWVDAVQVNEGAETDYQPMSNIESAVVLDRAFPLYSPGEDVTGQIRIVEYSGTPVEAVFAYDVVDDYFGNKTVSKNEEIKTVSGEVVKIPLKIKENRRGGYAIRGRIAKPEKSACSSTAAYFAVSECAAAKTLVPADRFSHGVNLSPYASGYWGHPSSAHVLSKKDGFDNYFEYYASQGVRWFRDWSGRPAFTWRDVEPEPGKFNWRETDYFVENAKKHNIRVMPVLGGASFEDSSKAKRWYFKRLPDWVIKRAEILPAPDANKASKGYRLILPRIEDWKNYVKAIVERYKGKISHYEIMNEPNLYMEPEQYTKYLKAAYETAKSVDPDCKIVGFCATGDLGGQLVNFMEGCFKLDGLKYADIVSFHPYNARLTGTPKSAQAMIAQIKEKKAKYGGKDKPLWNTELYYMNTEVESGFDAAIIKGNEIARRYFIDLGEGLQQSMPLPPFFNSKNTVFRNRHSGLHTSLVPSFRYVIYAQLARHFEGAKSVARIKWPNRDVCYVVEKNGQFIAAVWNYDKTKFDFLDMDLPSSQVDILDMFGNLVKVKEIGKVALKLRNEPYYIFWKGKDKNKFLNALKNANIRGEKSVLLAGAKINRNSLILEVKNTTSKSIKGLLKVTATPGWLKTAGAAMTYGPVPPHESCKVSVPVKLEAGKNRSGKVSVSISTSNEQLDFEADVFRPLFLDCKKLSTPPEIDGKIEAKEWAIASSFALDKIEDVKLGPPLKWTGANDCSAIVRAGYDSKNIYFAISVKDDMKGQRIKGMLWTGDAVELFLHTSPEIGKIYTDNTYQMFFAPMADNGPPMNFKSKGRWKSTRQEKGYEIEVAVPFHELGINPSEAPGMSIDFDIAIDDADEGRRENQMVWSGDGKNYKDRSLFGRLYFEK